MSEGFDRGVFFDQEDLLQRILFLYGHTDDSFYVSGTLYNSLEYLLERHLQQLGYDLVMFYNGVQHLYCYSQSMAEKRDSFFGAQREEEDRRSNQVMQELNDILGGDAAEEEAEPSQSRSAPLRLHIDDLQIATFADQVMRREDVRSAIIFSDGWDLLDNTDAGAMRTLGSYFRSWYHLGATNQNLVIVCFGTLTQAHIDEYVKHNVGWGFLRDKMIQGKGFTQAVKYISIPQADELEGRLRLEEDYRRLSAADRDRALAGTQCMLHEMGNSLKGLDAFLNSEPNAVQVLSSVLGDDDDALNTLSSTRGWEAVAKTVRRIAKSIDLADRPKVPAPPEGIVSRMTEMQGFAPSGVCINMVLKGNPGTGKTTIATYLGQIYRKLGLLPSGHVVTAARDDLVGRFVGHTAANTRAKIEEAMGGILFIDEAYSLYRNTAVSGNDFGIEAIDTLVEAMTRSVGSFAVVLAGYPEPMDHMLDANPGLRSRFGENIVTIEDYEPDLLQEITTKFLADKYGHTGITFDPSLLMPGTSGNRPLDVFFNGWFAARNRKQFGNARDCHNLVEALVPAVEERGGKTILKEDFTPALQLYFKEADLDLDSVLASLDDIVGQQAVKDKLLSIVKQLRLRNRQIAARPDAKVRTVAPGHYAFCGNPGTGKSTIADKFAQLLGALRVTGRFTPTRITGAMLLREMQSGGIEGMRKVIEDARGGVLFIDEAHQLLQVPMALQLLLDPMLELRDELCVILAYYADDEQAIFRAEPGLESRLSGVFHFEDYDSSALVEIFRKKVASAGFMLAEGVTDAARSWFERRLAEDMRSSNGRYAEHLLAIVEASMAERLDTERSDLSERELFEILPEDILSSRSGYVVTEGQVEE